MAEALFVACRRCRQSSKQIDGPTLSECDNASARRPPRPVTSGDTDRGRLSREMVYSGGRKFDARAVGRSVPRERRG